MKQLEHGSEKLAVYNADKPMKKVHEIELPGFGSVGKRAYLSDGDDKVNPAFFYKFSGFLDPGSSYRFDLKTFKQELISRSKLPDNINLNLDEFTQDLIHFKSKDGTEVPMFIVRKKKNLPDVNVKPEKPLPVYLYAYGGFSVVKTPKFSAAHMVWMNNLNGVYAQVGIRGGGDLGEDWH